MNLNLDKDLREELSVTLEREGVVWAALPTLLQMRYLTPLLDRQYLRELPVLRDVGCSV